MKNILIWEKVNVIEFQRRIIVKINKHRKFVKFEIKNYVWLNYRNINIAKFFDKLNNKKLNSFKVFNKQKQTYKLKLLDIMHIYLIFHSWLFKKNFKNLFEKQQNNFFESIILNKNSK